MAMAVVAHDGQSPGGGPAGDVQDGLEQLDDDHEGGQRNVRTVAALFPVGLQQNVVGNGSASSGRIILALRQAEERGHRAYQISDIPDVPVVLHNRAVRRKVAGLCNIDQGHFCPPLTFLICSK